LNASARLRRKIDLVTPPFARACQRIFEFEPIAELLPQYLIKTHAIIRSTVSLMEAVAGHALHLANDDLVAAGVASYLMQHVEEERHHGDWLLEDLEWMGISRDRVLAEVPSPAVASLSGAQWYWGLHYHPIAVMGYFAFMENFPPSPSFVADLQRRTGFPSEAFRTIAAHGELDPFHREEIDRVIDSMPLGEARQSMLGLSAITTANLLTRSLEEVLENIADGDLAYSSR
jgi:hypothetical protein